MRVFLLPCLAWVASTLTVQQVEGFLTHRSSVWHQKSKATHSFVRKLNLGASVSDDAVERNRQLPAVEFVDPKTNCKVVLLGCFHGTESSARDVEEAITSDTNVVVLELCTSRFADLRREIPQENELPWMVAYLRMISTTAQQRGLPTGVAAGVLAGFSGLQSAISGFSPGLEFTTAATCAQTLDADIILADQDVDETLRQVGSLPKISFDIALSDKRIDEWQVHQATLKRAVVGDTVAGLKLPQVQLGTALIRNIPAVLDLVRLTVPPTLLFLTLIHAVALVTHADLLQDLQTVELMTPMETVVHWLVSAGILATSYLLVALPSVRVILTERDEILTTGIQAACERAGANGKVVAVLGMLHVNGVAKRMLAPDSPEFQQDTST